MTMLGSLRDGYSAWIFGASGGLGRAFAGLMNADPRCGKIVAAARSLVDETGKIRVLSLSLGHEDDIASAVSGAAREGPPDLVLVTTGILHAPGVSPEKTIRSLDAATLMQVYAVNAIGPALIAKHALPHLPKDRKSVFAALSARVGSISDNRAGGWHAYRASKAALNMLIRNAGIELATRNRQAICVALHPGTVDTRLSKPFQKNVPAEKLFAPETSAAHLLKVVDRLVPGDTGNLFAWNGDVIPF